MSPDSHYPAAGRHESISYDIYLHTTCIMHHEVLAAVELCPQSAAAPPQGMDEA
jgi:hypothetical protein